MPAAFRRVALLDVVRRGTRPWYSCVARLRGRSCLHRASTIVTQPNIHLLPTCVMLSQSFISELAWFSESVSYYCAQSNSMQSKQPLCLAAMARQTRSCAQAGGPPRPGEPSLTRLNSSIRTHLFHSNLYQGKSHQDITALNRRMKKYC